MAGKAHVVIFVEGDTDKLLFDALVRYYLKRRPAKLQGNNGYERLKSLYKAGGQVYVKGFGSEGLVAALDMGVIRQKRATALRQLEILLGIPT